MNLISCPFCNALYPPEAVDAAALRPTCPKCGELLPPSTAALAKAPLPQSSQPPPTADRFPPEVRAANRRVLGTVLLIMLTSAAIGLAYALYTVDFRRGNDIKPFAVAPSGQFSSVAELPLLGYLPPDVEQIAGLKVAEMMALSEGKKLLTEGKWAPLLQRAETWTGQKIEDIEHILVAVQKTSTLPRVIVGVFTRRQLRPAELGQHLKLQVLPKHHAKPTFGMAIEPVGDMQIWYPDTRTVMAQFSLEPAPLDFPFPPKTPSENVSPALRDLLTQRLGKASLAWGFGTTPNIEWLSLMAWKEYAGQLPVDAESLRDVRAFTIGLEMNPKQEPRWVGHLQAVDADALKKLLVGLEMLQAPNLKVEMPPADAPEAERLWLSWQASRR